MPKTYKKHLFNHAAPHPPTPDMAALCGDIVPPSEITSRLSELTCGACRGLVEGMQQNQPPQRDYVALGAALLKIGDLAKFVGSLRHRTPGLLDIDKTYLLRELYEVEDLLRTAALQGNYSNAVASPGKALRKRQPSKKKAPSTGRASSRKH